jgi:hypothetical protein
MVKRLFPDGEMPYRWVNDPFVATGEGEFELCADAMEAVWHAFGSGPSLLPETVDKLVRNFPDMLVNWKRRRVVTPCIHAEIRIILDLTSSRATRRHIMSPSQRCPIGCSKRSCFCCTLWIDAYNEIYGTQWMTSGSHGKPYANWALPGSACTHEVDENGRTAVDVAVLRGVSTRLTDVLDWLLPGLFFE